MKKVQSLVNTRHYNNCAMKHGIVIINVNKTFDYVLLKIWSIICSPYQYCIKSCAWGKISVGKLSTIPLLFINWDSFLLEIKLRQCWQLVINMFAVFIACVVSWRLDAALKPSVPHFYCKQSLCRLHSLCELWMELCLWKLLPTFLPGATLLKNKLCRHLVWEWQSKENSCELWAACVWMGTEIPSLWSGSYL